MRTVNWRATGDDDPLLRLPERPSSRWHRAGLGRRGERWFQGIAAVWFGFRWYMRLEQTGAFKRKPPPQIKAQDTVRCPTCGVYVTKGSSPCGRPVRTPAWSSSVRT